MTAEIHGSRRIRDVARGFQFTSGLTMTASVITDVVIHAPALEMGAHYSMVSGAVGFLLASAVRGVETVLYYMPKKIIIVGEDPFGSGPAGKQHR
ncbi:hypothetical protein [Nocardia sp. NPDC059239]|uniref:hypothetical protein n=1 Tax=Nocardia sp. NPDC059239 TaxID=3346785 RepID=UPI0036C47F50